MLTKRNPANPAKPQTAIRVAPEKVALRKNLTSSSGSIRCSSQPTSAAADTAEPVSNPMIRPEPQPSRGASMIA